MMDHEYSLENIRNIIHSDTQNVSNASNAVQMEQNIENPGNSESQSGYESDGSIFDSRPEYQDNVIDQTVESKQKHATKNTESDSLDCSDHVNKKHKPDYGDEDGSACNICFENWTISGDHRICSLKCGHLFGHTCVMRWLSMDRKNKTCPTCKTKASLNDIRFIYAKKVVALDTSELDKMRAKLETSSTENNRLQLEVARLSCTVKLQQEKIEQLNNRITFLKQNQSATFQSEIRQSQNSDSVKLVFEKSIELRKEGSCRVMTFNNNNLLVVSMKSPNTLFSGYGIRKIETSDFHVSQFVPLHSNIIRDLMFHPQTGELLLSVSLDRTAKIMNITNNTVINTFQANVQLWSCCWDSVDANIFYVGTQRGAVIQYDLRQPNVAIAELTIPQDMSPVVSLASVQPYLGDVLDRGGIICCKLTSCWTFEKAVNGFNERKMEIAGPFISMCYNNDTKEILLSMRPNQNSVCCRHVVCYLSNGVDNNLLCNVVHSFQGGSAQSTLSRTCQIPMKNITLYGVYQETSKTVNIWNGKTSDLLVSLPCSEPIMDICYVPNDELGSLLALSEKKLKIYKIRNS